MPSLYQSTDRRRSRNSTAAGGPEYHIHHQHNHHQPMSKPSPKILSLILRAIIMSLLTSLFFLFLGLAAIFLLHLFLAGRHRRRQQQQSQPYLTYSTSSSSGISLDDLQNLPEFICSKSNLISDSECVICLDRIRDGYLFRILPVCSHAFHLDCIDTWLFKAPACPICRARVYAGSGTGTEQGKQLWDVRA